MLKYLLDTNIVIHVIKQRPIEALGWFNKQLERMAISAITLAELVHGAEKSQFPVSNLAVVEDFCSRLITLPYGDSAAYHYGSILALLEQAGKPSA